MPSVFVGRSIQDWTGNGKIYGRVYPGQDLASECKLLGILQRVIYASSFTPGKRGALEQIGLYIASSASHHRVQR